MRWIAVLLVSLTIAEWYSYQAVKTAFDSKWGLRIYLLISAFLLAYIVITFSRLDYSMGQSRLSIYTIGLILVIYVPKIVISLFLAGEDIFRILLSVVNYFVRSSENAYFIESRRKFISQLALGVAAIPFLSLIYGIAKGRYNFKVFKQTIYFDDLPEEFDGFRILQLSDIHCGSFDNHKEVNQGIDLINEQEADLLVFTGDIVNTLASEMDDWYYAFERIKTPEFGKYSILGNHDYGEYANWKNPQDKEKNFEEIKAIHPKIGFKLLLDENIKLKKGNSEIALIGVENIGIKFKKAGDLKKASEGLNEKDFKILLSHDPSHWDSEVQNSPMNYQLTLSGHTHGMQFGIEIPGDIKWSPVQYIYKHWAGLYKNLGRYLYVNRGFGYHAYPGRVGVWPEITVLELKRK